VNILGTFWQHIISAFVEMTKADHSCSGILGCQAPRFLEIWNEEHCPKNESNMCSSTCP